jgi:hypothetical protein
MNGFLVVLLHTMDDIPVSLHATRAEAEAAAQACPSMPSDSLMESIGCATSEPVCVSIIEFVEGEPVSMGPAKYFHESIPTRVEK